MLVILRLFQTLLLCSIVNSAHAEKLGHVFPVIEEDLLAVIQKKLTSKNIMQQIQDTVSNKITAYMQSLPSKSQLSRFDGVREHTIIPVIHVPSVNNMPAREVQLLSVIHDFKPVLMFDAGDALQVDWLIKMLADNSTATVIAVGGNVIQAMKHTKHLVAFDNTGEWARRFELQGLPAKITHNGGLALTIVEGLGDV